jgi:gamma-glutamylcyclotransferase (GGCT)/AIG2-like uncharacterized protein YtfP
MTRVFVYGTLRSDGRANYLMGDSPKLGEARTATSYCLRDMGPYPAMVRGQSESGVYGEVYECSDEVMKALDCYECVSSGLFERAEVELQDGTKANAYLFARKFGHLNPPIKDGKWDMVEKKWC